MDKKRYMSFCNSYYKNIKIYFKIILDTYLFYISIYVFFNQTLIIYQVRVFLRIFKILTIY
jgi:hypothetical protein